MNSGKFDKYITIKRSVQTDGALNEVIDTYTDLSSVWAKLMTPTAREVFEGKYKQSDKTIWRIKNTDINQDDQITYNSNTYYVNTVVVDDGIMDDLIVTTTLIK